MICKTILYCGQPGTIACDANCSKAWGINSRPSEQLSENPDDYAYLSDSELKDAPALPGTSEGSDMKPQRPEDRLNRWCARECERCSLIAPWDGVWDASILKDFSERVYNIPSSAPGAGGEG